ncbi:MAG: class I SAM-dependent methyltransferase [Thermoleophilaceae bacterium]|nr:class I SAM-dependent methyltransferase [Thermoleophilaceae bacterium]
MNYTVELDDGAGRDQAAESLVVRFADGREERMRLHEYDRVYAIPGLYEEVVQRRLECLSPRVLADALLAHAGLAPEDLRVFDLAAGNGVTGEELAARGVAELVGSDNIPEARDAAERDRPGLYSTYVVGDIDETPELRELVRSHSLNALVCAGALGLGHISAASFDRLWSEFPAGSLFSASVEESLAEPGGSDFGDYLAELDSGDEAEVLQRERFRHRSLMGGGEVHYVAVVARKR